MCKDKACLCDQVCNPDRQRERKGGISSCHTDWYYYLGLAQEGWMELLFCTPTPESYWAPLSKDSYYVIFSLGEHTTH